MTRTHNAKRLHLAAAALLASILIGPAAPIIDSAEPLPAVVASSDIDLPNPDGFEIDGDPDGFEVDGTQT